MIPGCGGVGRDLRFKDGYRSLGVLPQRGDNVRVLDRVQIGRFITDQHRYFVAPSVAIVGAM